MATAAAATETQRPRVKAGPRSALAPGNRALATQDARENLKVAVPLPPPLPQQWWKAGLHHKGPTEEDWWWMSGPGALIHTLNRLFIKYMKPACPSTVLDTREGNGRQLKTGQDPA